MCPPVCSECVVHGIHKQHDVSTIKKAYPQIMSNIDDLQVKVNSKIDELQLQEQKLEAKKRDIVDQTTSVKQNIANNFEELRARIDNKEKEVMQ